MRAAYRMKRLPGPFLLLNSFVIKLMGKEKRRKRPGPHHFCFSELPSAYLGLMVRFSNKKKNKHTTFWPGARIIDIRDALP